MNTYILPHHAGYIQFYELKFKISSFSELSERTCLTFYEKLSQGEPLL